MFFFTLYALLVLGFLGKVSIRVPQTTTSNRGPHLTVMPVCMPFKSNHAFVYFHIDVNFLILVVISTLAMQWLWEYSVLLLIVGFKGPKSAEFANYKCSKRKESRKIRLKIPNSPHEVTGTILSTGGICLILAQKPIKW